MGAGGVRGLVGTHNTGGGYRSTSSFARGNCCWDAMGAAAYLHQQQSIREKTKRR